MFFPGTRRNNPKNSPGVFGAEKDLRGERAPVRALDERAFAIGARVGRQTIHRDAIELGRHDAGVEERIDRRARAGAVRVVKHRDSRRWHVDGVSRAMGGVERERVRRPRGTAREFIHRARIRRGGASIDARREGWNEDA